jgi:hypothetical protein
MQISGELMAAIVGAVVGSTLTAIISFVLHRQSLAHQQRLTRQKVDWDFLSSTLPVLSRLFSSTTPDRLKTENDVFLMLDDVYASLREGTFRGIFSGSAHTEPISSNVHSYSEALKKYVRREMSREHLEEHRKRALDDVSAHWKKLLPDVAGS